MTDTKYSFIKDMLKAIGKTQKDLAEYLGIEAPKVNLIVTGDKREIQTDEIFPIADFLHLDREEFSLYVSGKTKKIPFQFLEDSFSALKIEKKQNTKVSIDVLDARACCGNGINNFSEKVVGSYLMSEQDVKRLTSTSPDNLKIIKTVGESMLPTIKPGEFVLIDLSCKTPTSDGLYVLCVGEDLVVRRIQIDPVNNSIEIISDNKTYKTKVYQNFRNVNVVGRVLFHMKIEQTF